MAYPCIAIWRLLSLLYCRCLCFFLLLLFFFDFVFIQLRKISRIGKTTNSAWHGMAWCGAPLPKLLVHTFISHWNVYLSFSLCVQACVTHIFLENNFMLHDIRVVRFPSSHNFYLFLNDSAAAVGMSFKIFMVMR